MEPWQLIVGRRFRFMPGTPSAWLNIKRDKDGYIRGKLVKVNATGTAQVEVQTKWGHMRPMYVSAERLEPLAHFPKIDGSAV
jgi:hypothetical protein